METIEKKLFERSKSDTKDDVFYLKLNNKYKEYYQITIESENQFYTKECILEELIESKEDDFFYPEDFELKAYFNLKYDQTINDAHYYTIKKELFDKLEDYL